MNQFWLGRKYQLCKSLYFDDYMKALNVGLVLRKMGNSLFPIFQMYYDEDNDQYTMSITTEYKSQEITFKLNTEFNEETLDGRMCTSCVTLHGNKMIHLQNNPKVPTTIVREFCEDGMLVTAFVCNVKTVRFYQMIEEE